MIYLECKSFLLEARGSLHDSARISRKRFVSRSSHLARWISNTSLPHVPTFHSPFPRHGRDSSLFPRGGIHLGGELSVLFFSLLHRAIARPRGGGKRGTDFEGKLWIFTGRARAYRHSRGHPLKFISEYRWNSTRREEGGEIAARIEKSRSRLCFAGRGLVGGEVYWILKGGMQREIVVALLTWVRYWKIEVAETWIFNWFRFIIILPVYEENARKESIIIRNTIFYNNTKII